MTDFIAGEDIRAGQMVKILADNVVYLYNESVIDKSDLPELFIVDRDVKQGEAITYWLSAAQPPRLVPSILNQKEWAVLTDDQAHCDLTYQEAKQLEIALVAQKAKGVCVVTNAAGKRGQGARIPSYAGSELIWKTQSYSNVSSKRRSTIDG